MTDKGTYKLVAKNEKGEAASQTVELIDIPVGEDETGKKPQFSQGLRSMVITLSFQ